MLDSVEVFCCIILTLENGAKCVNNSNRVVIIYEVDVISTEVGNAKLLEGGWLKLLS